MTKWFLGKENKIKSSAVIWNSLGGALNAGQSAIILNDFRKKILRQCLIVVILTAVIMTLGVAIVLPLLLSCTMPI